MPEKNQQNTNTKAKEVENARIQAKSIAPPPLALPPDALAKGTSFPPLFGNNATTYYKPHSMSTGVGTVRNSGKKGFRT